MNTLENLKDFWNIPVVFTYYNEYKFTFDAKLPSDETLSVTFGGYPDDIREFSCHANMNYSILELAKELDICWAYISKGDKIIREF